MFNNKKKADENTAEEVNGTADSVRSASGADANAAEQTEEAKQAPAPEAESAGQAQPEENEKSKPDVDALQKKLDEALTENGKVKSELAKLNDIRLRLAAEYDNFRKRSQREKDSLYADVTASSVAALLPIVDNVERALGAENASAEDLRKGVEMINTQAKQALEKLGVSAFGEVGEEFDPQCHHCVGTVDSADVDSGKIAGVLQKGYKMGDKIIRPAMVQTAN